jgi:hypothetical protein
MIGVYSLYAASEPQKARPQMERTLLIGQHVKVTDEVGVEHDGLVTANWGNDVIKEGSTPPTINVLYVTNDPAKRDPYGNQIERLSSCSHRSQTTAPGRFWDWPKE